MCQINVSCKANPSQPKNEDTDLEADQGKAQTPQEPCQWELLHGDIEAVDGDSGSDTNDDDTNDEVTDEESDQIGGPVTPVEGVGEHETGLDVTEMSRIRNLIQNLGESGTQMTLVE